MKKTAILFADGFEEIEALTAVDLLRRGGVACDIISIGGAEVCGTHGIFVHADKTLAAAVLDDYDGLILPGGIPGTLNLAADARVLEAVRAFHAAGKLTAAICAAPTVLARAGILSGRSAICYPGMEAQLTGANVCEQSVVVDGTVITSRGIGTAIPFALALVAYFEGEARADSLAHDIVFR